MKPAIDAVVEVVVVVGVSSGHFEEEACVRKGMV